MAMTVSLIGLLLLLFFPCRMSDERATYLEKVMHAVENIVDYYKKNYHDLNVDGFFGLRVLEGHLDLLVQEYEGGRHRNLTSEFILRLKQFKNTVTATCQKAADFVKRDDSEYYQRLKFVVGQPWKFLKPHRKLNHQLKWNPEMYIINKEKKLNEETSDMCMGELMGSNPMSNGQECQISDNCLIIMTNKGLSGYGITHQILWSMLAEVKGCHHILNEKMRESSHGSVDGHRDEFCVNNFHEMTDFFNVHLKGKVVPKYQDLFLEQQFVCPSLGFYQFLSYDYLDQILAWQKPNGCYGTMPKPRDGASEILKTVKGFEDYDYERNADTKSPKLALPQKVNSIQRNNQHLNVIPEGNTGEKLVHKQNDITPKPIVLADNKSGYKQNTSVDVVHNLANLTGTLRNVQVGTGMSRNKNGIMSQAKVEENDHVVIQKEHGLVGRFVTDQSNKIPVNIVGDKKSRNSVPDTQSQNRLYVQQPNNQIHRQSESRREKLSRNQGVQNHIVQNRMQKTADKSNGVQQFSKTSVQQNLTFLDWLKDNGEENNVNSVNNVPQMKARKLLWLEDTGNVHFYKIGRRLLSEKAMKEGCLAHKTAVAAGALAMYLRYLIEPGPLKLQHNLKNLNPNRFLMSVEVTKNVMSNQLKDTKDGHHQNMNALVYDNDGAMMKPGHKNAGGPGIAMNNNVLAEQLHVSNDNDEDENYYAQDLYENNNHVDKREDVYKLKSHRLVQFDNANGLGMDTKVKHEENMDNYGEDGYKDDKNNEMDDGDYNEEGALKGNAGFEDVRVHVGRKPVIPKGDEQDYTYYEDNLHQHDDYNNKELEQEVKEKNVEQVVKDEVKDQEKVDRKDGIYEPETPKYYQFTTHSRSPTIMFMIISVSMAALVFIMYRFIRSRRIHIRYHPRSFMRL